MLEPFRLDRFPRFALQRVPARNGRSAPRTRMSDHGRLRVAIIGSGNIGTDLLIKVERSPHLEVAGVAGIDPTSAGPARWRASTATSSPTGASRGLLELVDDIDLAFDATSAAAHAEHARLLAGARHPQRRPDARRRSARRSCRR